MLTVLISQELSVCLVTLPVLLVLVLLLPAKIVFLDNTSTYLLVFLVVETVLTVLIIVLALLVVKVLWWVIILLAVNVLNLVLVVKLTI